MHAAICWDNLLKKMQVFLFMLPFAGVVHADTYICPRLQARRSPPLPPRWGPSPPPLSGGPSSHSSQWIQYTTDLFQAAGSRDLQVVQPGPVTASTFNLPYQVPLAPSASLPVPLERPRAQFLVHFKKHAGQPSFEPGFACLLMGWIELWLQRELDFHLLYAL